MRFFEHGFMEAKVTGYICCRFKRPCMAWELLRELEMLYIIHTGMQAGFKFQEPPVRDVLVMALDGHGEWNGEKLRAVAKEVFSEMLELK